MKQTINPFLNKVKLQTDSLLMPETVSVCMDAASKNNDVAVNQAEKAILKQQKETGIRAERMAASSLAARKVVHEANNPLAIIKNYLRILGLKLSEEHPAQDDLVIINEEIERVIQIIHQLSNFSEPHIKIKETFDINNFITDLIRVIKQSLLTPFNIDIHLDLDFSLPYLNTERDALKQVFINLIKNSVEAMPGGGNIYIETKHNYDPEKTAEINRKIPRWIDISFKDDGPGIDKEIKKHLFEPYYSSKGKDHSGLGLSIVHQIINKLNGTITCPDHVDKGSMFIITLPAVKPLSDISF